MNYQNIMSQIITTAIEKRGQPENYSKGRKKMSRSGLHLHHIIPVSMGGSNDGSNIVIVTPREHFIIHWMLHRIYGGKMTVAFRMMIDGKYTACRKINSKLYEKLVTEGIEQRTADESWRKKNAEAVRRTVKTQSWIESNKHALEKMHNDPQAKANHAKAMRERSQDPKWIAMHKEHLKNMHASETYRENHRIAMEKLRTCEKFQAGAKERGARLKDNDAWKEAIRKSSMTKRKPVIGINLNDGAIVCFIGSQESNAAGFSDSKITCVVKGKRPTHKGHTWRYATYEEVEQYRPGHEWLELNKPT